MTDPPVPLLVGPANAAAVFGVPWRRLREHAARLGIKPIRIGVAYAFPAAELLRRLGEDAASESMPPERDGADGLRERLGLRLARSG